MSKLTQAEYAEELSRLDQELKLMQKELEDNLQLNDNFQKSIEEKGDELAHKDEFIMSLREKNAAELEQLRLEQESLNDNIVHEINFHTAEVQNLRVRRNRLQELVNENERLRDSIRFLEEKVNEDRHHHAISMHEMNREMKLLRQQMEQKLRKELAGLELSFQEEAFNALADRQKQAMLENAKLKDEVALQGVGISNLTARLIKQQIAADRIEKVLRKYDTKSHFLRERLAEATMQKNEIAKLRDAFIEEEANLVREKEELSKQLNILGFGSSSRPQSQTLDSKRSHSPTSSLIRSNGTEKKPPSRPQTRSTIQSSKELMNNLISQYTSVKERYRSLLVDQKIWIQRFDAIKTIFLDLRPLNSKEKDGQFLKKFFPLQELIDEISIYLHKSLIQDPGPQPHGTSHHHAMDSEQSSTTGFSRQASSQGSEVLLDIQQFIENDPDLAEALKMVKGKESSLLTAFQDGGTKAESPHPKTLPFDATAELLDNEEEERDDHSTNSSFTKDEDKDQNMVAWTLLKVITLWCGVETKIRNDLANFQENTLHEPLHPIEEVENNSIEEETTFDENVPVLSEPITPMNDDGIRPLSSKFGKFSGLTADDFSQSKHSFFRDGIEGFANTDEFNRHDEENYSNQEEGEEARKMLEESESQWEERLLNEILEAKERDLLNTVKSERTLNELDKSVRLQQMHSTGVPYYDNPPNSSNWVQLVPPKPVKNSVFANEIREKLMPKTYSLSLKDTQKRTKELLELADVGPPIIIHEFHSPTPRSSSSGDVNGKNEASSSNLFNNTRSSEWPMKSRLQSQESQILHYKADCDPLLFNQKKKNLTLPKSPSHPPGVGDLELSAPIATGANKFSKNRNLPRKLVLAMNRSASQSSMSQANTPMNPSMASALDKGFPAKSKSVLSHSTGALPVYNKR